MGVFDRSGAGTAAASSDLEQGRQPWWHLLHVEAHRVIAEGMLQDRAGGNVHAPLELQMMTGKVTLE